MVLISFRLNGCNEVHKKVMATLTATVLYCSAVLQSNFIELQLTVQGQLAVQVQSHWAELQKDGNLGASLQK